MFPCQITMNCLPCIHFLCAATQSSVLGSLLFIMYITPLSYWAHSMGPLCHALSLSSLLLWTSMRRRRATVATPGERQCGVRWLAVANGPNIFQMLLVLSYLFPPFPKPSPLRIWYSTLFILSIPNFDSKYWCSSADLFLDDCKSFNSQLKDWILAHRTRVLRWKFLQKIAFSFLSIGIRREILSAAYL